jgi:hypothetical protein
MSWRPAGMVAAGLWAAVAGGQAPEPTIVLTVPRDARPANPRALRDWMKKHTPEQRGVCAIPLIRVPLPRNTEPMPAIRPPKRVDPGIEARVPAPPCKDWEERR